MLLRNRLTARWLPLLVAPVLLLAACSEDGDPAAPAGPDLNAGLAGHYAFEGSADDATANGQDGVLLGGATVNGHLSVGSNDTDALSLPAGMLNGRTDFTVAGWVRMEVFHIWPSQWISGATTSDDNSLGIWYSPNENRWAMCLASNTYKFDMNSTFEDQGWHHIVVTRKGDQAALYIDGAVVTAALDVPSDPLAIDDGGLIVGQDQDTLGGGFSTDNSLAGGVDELRIYGRAVSAAEVKAIYDLGR